MASCFFLPDDLMQVRSRVFLTRLSPILSFNKSSLEHFSLSYLAFTVVFNRSEIVFLIRVFKLDESELGEGCAEPRCSRGENAIELIDAETRADDEIFRVSDAH